MQKVMSSFAALLIAIAAWAVPSAGAAEPVPVADFFRSPMITSPVLSPNGKHVAAAIAGGPQGRRRLVVLNVADWSQSKLLAAFGDADVQTVHWVNDDRLVFTLTDTQSAFVGQVGQGLYAVDRDGKAPPRRLIKRRWSNVSEASSRRELDGSHRFVSVLRDGSNDVVVSQYVLDGRNRLDSVSLFRLDTASAGTRLLTPNAPPHVMSWAVDTHGEPRFALARDATKTRLYIKPAAAGPWTLLRELDRFDAAQVYEPLGIDRNDALYLVATDSGTGDTSSLLRVDLRKADAPPHPLVKLDGHDFRGNLVWSADGEVLGVRHVAEEIGTHWLDPVLKKIQADVDRLLPDTNNLIACGDCRSPATVLVWSASDRQPPRYLLYDVAAGTLKPVASSRPWIRPPTMAEREFARFAAHDGLEIPVHVTRPPNSSGPAPMIVLVHGGPWARAAGWNWDAESQFLASRGYVVVEPEFRGSHGYGSKLFRAGWKQWGLAMQDDVADAARWAIAKGYADPKRVCIAGASYGGYSTLMGLIRDPALFRCGVQWAGVTDIALQYDQQWSQAEDEVNAWGLPVLIGDREKDAAQFAATSPLQLASKIRQPVLMAHGEFDRVVPIEQGIKMRNALRHNPNVEWIEYPTEGHGWTLEANNVDFWNRVERFLDRHLMKSPP
jgi:dipeptidyl aminopeptidase/acylaminoacyl peptidase